MGGLRQVKTYTKDNPPAVLSARKLMTYELKVTASSNNFPKKFRHSIVDKILNTTFELMTCIRAAYEGYDKNNKINYINTAIVKCENVKDILPCVLETLHPQCSINHWNALIDDVEKQLKDWKGSLMGRK